MASLFNRNNTEQVPEIEIQGDQAIIPNTEEDSGRKETKKPKSVQVEEKTWGTLV